MTRQEQQQRRFEQAIAFVWSKRAGEKPQANCLESAKMRPLNGSAEPAGTVPDSTTFETVGDDEMKQGLRVSASEDPRGSKASPPALSEGIETLKHAYPRVAATGCLRCSVEIRCPRLLRSWAE